MIAPHLAPHRLRTNGLRDPHGLDEWPVFSWHVADGGRDVEVATARVRVESTDATEVWDSGPRVLTRVPAIEYGGPDLDAGTEYRWRVRIEDAAGRVSEWSEPTGFEAGLLGRGLGEARWIRLDETAPRDAVAPTQYVRHEFELPVAVVRARAYWTALGWYRLLVNGVDVTAPQLVPRFTSFDHRVEYQVYDVTERLVAGRNAVGAIVADGRFRGRNSGFGSHAVFGDHASTAGRIEIDLADGGRVILVTDDSWAGGHGEIVRSDPKLGEHVDLRLRAAWASVGGVIPERVPVVGVDENRTLVGPSCEPVAAHESLPPVSVTPTASGAVLVDFGQNLTGTTRLVLRGEAGTTVAVRHGEVLGADGLDRSAMAEALGPFVQEDSVVLAGGGPETFEPSFSIQGFRYAEVTGLAAPLSPDDVRAVWISSDLEYTSEFVCADDRITRLHDNIVRTMRSNSFDVPTDNLIRERSGWTADAMAFLPTALLLGESAAFYRNWLRDFPFEQGADGRIPVLVPIDSPGYRDPVEWARWLERGYPREYYASSAFWGDTVVLAPWEIYRATGDPDVLEELYPAMRKWVDFSARRAAEGRHPSRAARGPAEPHERYLVDTGYHWGEALARTAEDEERPEGFSILRDLDENPRDEFATAHFAHSARLLGRIGRILGDDSAEHYEELGERAVEAWRREYLGSDGRLEPDLQATYARALAFDLVPAELRGAVVDRLVGRIRGLGNRIGTGVSTTWLVLPALSAAGRPDVALDLLLQTAAPSWLDQLDRGATTVWETWEGSGSRNQTPLAAVGQWFYSGLAGISPAEPGWRRISIDPYVNDRIPWVRASVLTPWGRVRSGWRLHGNRVELEVAVPPGARATVRFPGAVAGGVREGGRPFVEFATTPSGDGVATEVGSGTYVFGWDLVVSSP
jgi:alpha-L-rhamnosidase